MEHVSIQYVYAFCRLPYIKYTVCESFLWPFTDALSRKLQKNAK